MTKTKTIESALVTSLMMAATALALLLASPAVAAPRGEAVKERVAELCTVSDTDLVGKRLAKECRAQVRAEAERRLARAEAASKDRLAAK